MHRLTVISPAWKITLIKAIRDAGGTYTKPSPIEGRADETFSNIGLKTAKDVAEMILDKMLVAQPEPLIPDEEFHYFLISDGYFRGGYADTKSLTSDMASLIDNGTDPDSILVVFGYRAKFNTRKSTECTVCNM